MSSPNRLENLRSLQIANWDMAFATAFAALVGGSFQQAFALALGANKLMLSVLIALPAFIGVLQIPGSILGERFKSYKKFVAIGGFFWRFWWIPVALLPLAPPSWPRLEILVVCIVLSAVSIFMVNATYNSWLSFLVPESHRGWYFSRRIAIATAVGALVVFPFSILLDRMRAQGELLNALSIIFTCGIIFAFISYYFYLRMPNTLRESVAHGAPRQDFKSLIEPLIDPSFRRLMVFLVFFVFAQTVAAAFFFPYGYEVLKLDFVMFQVFGACHAAASLASSKLWGYLSDKYGNKPVLFLSGSLLAIAPLMWAITIPGALVWNICILIFGHVMAGVSWTGVAVGQGNIILAVSRPEMRAQSIGLSQATTSVVGGLSPLLGGLFMQFSQGMFDEQMQYDILFIANSVLRIGSVFLLFGLTDPTSSRIRDFMKQIAGVRPKGISAMRQLSSAETPDEKQRAIKVIGQTGMKLAESELIHLLNDPSPSVRKDAAIALRSVGGEIAAEHILKRLEYQPEEVDEELIETLGTIGNENAVPLLTSYLDDPGPAIRRAAAKALGRLASPEAFSPLMVAAQKAEDLELRRAAIQALRMIGNRAASDVILPALTDEAPSVRIAAAEASVHLGITAASSILRKALLEPNPDDPALPEFAYSLSFVGNVDDIPLLLRAAAIMKTDLARRRCLLAAARLLGVEATLYRLLMADPVARDQSLIEIVKESKSKHVSRAVSRWHSSKESEAIKILYEAFPSQEMEIISNYQPKEGFLLALSYLSNHVKKHTS